MKFHKMRDATLLQRIATFGQMPALGFHFCGLHRVRGQAKRDRSYSKNLSFENALNDALLRVWQVLC